MGTFVWLMSFVVLIDSAHNTRALQPKLQCLKIGVDLVNTRGINSENSVCVAGESSKLLQVLRVSSKA